MYELLKEYQLNIMLILIGVCAIASVFVYTSKALAPKKKMALVLMEVYSVILLTFDRFAYIYHGNESELGYYMVRITNFMVFFMMLMLIHAFNLYLSDLLLTDCELKKAPLSIRIIELLITVGILLLIISQFTGLYYTFDEHNAYQRSPYFFICYIIPIISTIIQVITVIVYCKNLRPKIYISLLLFPTVSILSSFIQLFAYGISLTNITVVGISILLFLFAIMEVNEKVERANRIEIDYLKEEQKALHRLFEQTVTAMVNAIDSKDSYTHGHSSRVAEYSRKLAELDGMSEEECNNVYYSALLHDVGKIGIPDTIINKDGKLTDEEYEIIKQHPVIGEQILSSISEYPYLSIAAHHHHERYDGKGYPDKLKGEDIPKIARIVAVADAYDAMTSMRSYRDAIPQQKVREEIIKCSGTQFDPVYAKYMQHLIDVDTEYQMREKEEIKELAGKNELKCYHYRQNVSEGIYVSDNVLRMHFTCTPLIHSKDIKGFPAFVLFDSLDGRIHTDERMVKELNYFEYGEIKFDGTIVISGARKIEGNTQKNRHKGLTAILSQHENDYYIEAVRYKDHAHISITNLEHTFDVTVALPDSTRYLYLGLTGEQCHISNVSISPSNDKANENTIPRIAEEISYIADQPVGDIPNIQIDGFRTESSEKILIKNNMTLTFHTMSLPTARLVWHCPYIVIFSSDDNTINGKNYHEYALIRLDGENWDSDGESENEIIVNKNDDFEGWDIWKDTNKEGMDISISLKREGNTITTETENAGIYIKNITTITNAPKDIFVSLTGDQCALTNIKIN